MSAPPEPDHDSAVPALPPELTPSPLLPPVLAVADPAAVSARPKVSLWILGYLAIWLATIAGFVALLVLGADDGELFAFVSTGVGEGLPVWVCILAYLGVYRPWARVASWFWLGALLFLAALLGVGSGFASVGIAGEGATLSPGDWLRVLGLLASSFTVAGLASVLQLPWARAFWGRIHRRGDLSERQLLALAGISGLTVLFVLPQLFLGEPPLLALVQAEAAEESEALRLFRSDLYGLAWMVVAAFFAVGYGIHRNFAQACERLGLVRLTWRGVGIATVFTGIALGVSYLLDHGIGWSWAQLGWPVTDEEMLDELFRPYLTPLGAVVVAVTAGVGEELLVRGILQPRIGIAWSSLFFGVLHAQQYYWDGVFSCFVFGLMLGWIRRRWNTTITILIHGLYDFVLVMWAVLERANGG